MQLRGYVLTVDNGTIFLTNLGSETFRRSTVSCDVVMLMLLEIRQTLTKKSGTAAPPGDRESRSFGSRSAGGGNVLRGKKGRKYSINRNP